MARILVVYFSRTGHTRKVAGEIASMLGADIEEIRLTSAHPPGFFDYMRSAWGALSGSSAAIMALSRNPDDYDLVILGTPVWASNMSTPMRAFIESHRHRFRRVAFFCTLGGSGAVRTLDRMAKLAGKPPVATLAITEGELKGAGWKARIEAFVQLVVTA